MQHFPEIGLAFGAYALTFSTKRVVAAYQRARRWIEGALGAFFTVAGIKLLASRS